MLIPVVHEHVHGVFWAMGAQNGWKDVQFGFNKKTLTPMTILGIITGVIAIILGNPFIMLFSVFHVFGGAGDILIVGMVLREKIKGKDVLIFDHPYDCGFILFEKK